MYLFIYIIPDILKIQENLIVWIELKRCIDKFMVWVDSKVLNSTLLKQCWDRIGWKSNESEVNIT